MDIRYDSVCGLYCGACQCLIATELDVLESFAQNSEMSAEDLRCQGCKSDVHAVFCKNCTFKECALSRKIEYCFQCGDYPCEMLVALQKDECQHHSIVIENLSYLQKHGVKTWLDQQTQRWSCSTCNERFSWYSTTCKNCGAQLYNCVEEEIDLKRKKTNDIT